MKNNFFLPVTDKECLKLNLELKRYINEHQDYLKCNIGGDINVFYGVFPKAIWHGGRTINFFNQRELSENEIKKIIDNLNNQNIQARMVFTNCLLEEQHLNDKYCNMILNAMDNGFGNAIIVASDLLDDYIRDTHPRLPLISSITKGSELDTFIKASQKEYEMIVIYPKESILNYIEKVNFDKNKIEILIGSGCAKCPMQKQHYEIESYNNLHQKELKTLTCYRTNPNCKDIKIPDYIDKNIVTNINLLNESGYYNYKIQGRGRDAIRIVTIFITTLIQKPYQNEVFEYFENYINNI